MKTSLLVLAATATLAMHVPAQAQSGGSLNDARSAINKGTAPGIVIIGAKRRAPEPSAAASEASAAATPAATGVSPGARNGDAAAAPSVATPLAERIGAALKWGDPPSGQPLNAARRLDSPALGIPLPSVSPAASQPTAK